MNHLLYCHNQDHLLYCHNQDHLLYCHPPKPPTGKEIPIKENTVLTHANDVFLNLTGYKVRFYSYGKKIILVAIIGWLISTFLFFELWLITSHSVSTMLKLPPTPSQVFSPFDIFIQPSFWFGITILTIPVILYAFAFATYLSILYDSRFAEVIKALTIDKDLRHRFIEFHSAKFSLINNSFRSLKLSTLKMLLLDFNLVKIISIPRGTHFNTPRSSGINHEEYRSNLNEAYKIKGSFMTELIQKLAIRMDGATVSGYFLPVMLLQFIVALSFVIPSLEFARLGTIGTDIFTTTCKEGENITTCGYISLWPLAWGVLGSFVYSFISLMDRIPRKDVTPRYFLNMALRYIFAIALSSVFFLAYYQGEYQAILLVL